MTALNQDRPVDWPWLAWAAVLVAGLLAPAAAMVMLANVVAEPASSAIAGPILAIGLMGAGMIGAAAARHFGKGLLLAFVAGAALLLLAIGLDLSALPHAASVGLATIIASASFAARGALFSRSAKGKGWFIAIAVVAGEAAILITALAEPGAIPDWLLVLLPAQWANMAIQSALSGANFLQASSALLALGGTAAATLLVERLWPRRWPYLIMFTTWLGLSALVWHYPSLPIS